jgi:hypothetical protein
MPTTPSSPPSGGLTLARRGQPANCVIVRPAAASPSQRYAAEELQRTLRLLTGVELPIATDAQPLPEKAILLGDTRHTAAALGEAANVTALGDEGFRLKTAGNRLLILAGPVRGTLYGVYELLERFGGCRWYASWHTVIPRLDELTIPGLDETQRPAFAMREPYWFDLFDGELAAHSKVNGNGMRLTPSHGGKVRFGDNLFVHTFNKLVPPEEFFDSHPEYFSEIGGQRIRDRTQLCLTHPDVARILTERLLAHIRKDPEARLFSVSQNDWGNPCTCPACRALDEREGSHAGTLIAFVNRVAEAVEREFPNVWIETLAYQYTRKPPRTLRPRANVVPRLCTIECDFSRPLDRSAFAQNKLFVEEIQGWSAITDKLYVWDYVTNFHDYVSPFPNVPALQGNVQFFRANRVVGLFEQGAYQGRHGEFAELKAWLLSRWLWNPDLPAKPLLDDFFAGYYGPAAPFVRRYFEELQSDYTGPEDVLRIYDDPTKTRLTDAFYITASELWRKAEAAVEQKPAYSYNVRLGALSVLVARAQRLPRVDGPVPPAYRELAADILARLGEARNVILSENHSRHEKLIAEWKRWTAS